MESDPGYQAIRLRGLAGLLRAGAHGLEELTNLPEVVFFIASTLDEMAGALEDDGQNARRARGDAPAGTLHSIRPDAGS